MQCRLTLTIRVQMDGGGVARAGAQQTAEGGAVADAGGVESTRAGKLVDDG